MTNMAGTIYGIVYTHDGIKCADIANEIHIPLNSVSGTLSMLKCQGKVFNEDKKWYATTSIYTIKRILDDIHESLDIPLGKWAEGYVSALTDYGIIDDNEFDLLIEYIKTSK